jgi:hypothetical protein
VTPAERVAEALGVTLAEYKDARAERIDRTVRALGHVVRRHARTTDLAMAITPTMRLAARIQPDLGPSGLARSLPPDEFFRRVLLAVATVAEDGAEPVALEAYAGQVQVSLARFLAFFRCPVVGAICEGLDEPPCVGEVSS